MSRLNILTENEQHEFENPPVFSAEAKTIGFTIDDTLNSVIKGLHGPNNKIGFLLQYVYFKACRRFFSAKLYREEDTIHASKLLGISRRKTLSKHYNQRTANNHKKKILDLFQSQSYITQRAWVEETILSYVKRTVDPRILFLDVLHQLHQHQVEIPSYHTLAESISEHYATYENTLLEKIQNNLTPEQMHSLDLLLMSPKKNMPSLLNQHKIINQSLRPHAIQSSVKLLEQISQIIMPLLPFITSLSLTPERIAYYATWIIKAKLSQIKQFPNQAQRALYLMSFYLHQYFIRQDTLVDIFLRSVRSAENSAKHQLNQIDQLTRTERRDAVRHLTKTNRTYREIIDDITNITKSTCLTDAQKVSEINTILEQYEKVEDEKTLKKIALFEQSLDSMAKDKDYFDILEKLSRKLQNRVSSILNVILFNPDNSDIKLIDAIHHFNEKKGNITHHAPQDFFSKDESHALNHDNGKFRPALYKILLFIHVAKAIKSGKMNLKYSYRYLAIQDYLISKSSWNADRNALLKSSNLEMFSNCKKTLRKLKDCLDEKYHSVNKRSSEGLNPYLTFNADKNDSIQIETPALEEKETRHISVFLKQARYIPVFQVLSDIDKTTSFSTLFAHHIIKNKRNPPSKNTFFAGIIGLGCNIGIAKMAHISSGVMQNTMSNTVKWYFTLKTLNAANERIRQYINRLALPHVFAHSKEQRHGSSDGRKVGVSVDCLLATYSFKYFGKDKGVSIYTFIDDRQVLFHHNVMSASDREAAYVIDGLNNNAVTDIDIHSTDTHGYTELIFATTHFLSVAFAPRIKSISEQCIYAFSTKKSYKKLGYKILPSRPIQQKLIENHWEDILRFMVTIKLNKVSASQLFKRLSSYAKDHPLYKALKEFGRIIKSIFILTYIDDVKLRQRIEKQLNRIEASNKFSNAVFYANNSEFKKSDPEEQNIAVACKVLIQNSIVLWNYLYLSQLLTNCADAKERAEMIALIREGSVLTWSHVNLHGEFDFRRLAANDFPFNLDRILALDVA